MKKPAKPAKRRLKGAEKEFVAHAKRYRLAPAKRNLASFSKKVAQDPYAALEWICEPCAAAADVHVWTAAIEDIEDGATLAEVAGAMQSELKADTHRGAIRSSSPLDTHLHAERLRALAKVISVCNDLLAAKDTQQPDGNSKAR